MLPVLDDTGAVRSGLDTVRLRETAEGASLALHPAGAPVRAAAWIIDLLIRLVFTLLLSLLAHLVGKLGSGFFLISMFLIDWFYNVTFEVMRGATPGKRYMGLRVVNDDGTPITWSASLLRNLLRVVDFLPLLYGLGLCWCLFSRDAQRLGDLAAGTLVVYAEPEPQPRLPEAVTRLAARACPRVLDYRAQQALVGFAERAEQLSPARREELADLLTDLHGQHGPDGVQRLYAYAGWIVGGR